MNIVITGASKGIGYETAKQFSSNGDRVIAIARNGDALKKLQLECSKMKGVTLIPVVFDITKDNLKDLAAIVKAELGTVDALINNAGLLVNKPFEQITSDDLLSVYETNVLGVFKLIQQLLPLMGIKSHIVNISSMGGFQGSAKFKGLSAYSSSKGALSVLSECLAEELKPRNIAVNCLCLGSVQTEMLAKAFPDYKAGMSAAQAAQFIGNFASTGHHYFNGKVLPVSISTP